MVFTSSVLSEPMLVDLISDCLSHPSTRDPVCCKDDLPRIDLKQLKKVPSCPAESYITLS